MESIFAYNTTLAVLTIVGMVAIVKVLAMLIFKEHFNKLKVFRWFLKKKVWMVFGFILALLAVAGTLIYSEAIGFPPCRLCWFQRIFMYPILILLGAGLWWKEVAIAKYVQLFAFAGSIVAIYHYLVQMSPSVSATCGAIGESCAERLVFEFGFVTIPLMSLTIFVMIFLLMFFRKRS